MINVKLIIRCSTCEELAKINEVFVEVRHEKKLQ